MGLGQKIVQGIPPVLPLPNLKAEAHCRARPGAVPEVLLISLAVGVKAKALILWVYCEMVCDAHLTQPSGRRHFTDSPNGLLRVKGKAGVNMVIGKITGHRRSSLRW